MHCSQKSKSARLMAVSLGDKYVGFLFDARVSKTPAKLEFFVRYFVYFVQVSQMSDASRDPTVVQLELGLVEVFISLCRFEWQAGFRELATALFQAQIEFSLFCPSLCLTENSKQRLFEHFWSSGGARVGEEGAIGWSTWLEKEEEDRQRIIKEETSQDNEKGGWTGWFEPLSKHKETDKPLEGVPDAAVEDVEEDGEPEDTNQEDDTETLLKMLGIDVNTGPSDNVKDVSTWTRWSVEESSRDCIHWMPVHAKSGLSLSQFLQKNVQFRC